MLSGSIVAIVTPMTADGALDKKTKELIVTPQRIRLTYQAKQAERGDYLLLRSATFDHDPLPPDTVQALLRHGIGLHQDLEGGTA